MQDEPIKIRDVNYMLFLKVPTVGDEKKSKKEKAEFMQQCSEQDLKVRDHIFKLLHEAESLEQLKTTLMDPNSLSEIMSVIRQHTEKKKAFGQQDFINKILQNSIGQSFSKRTQAETREGFQKFIKVYT